MDNNYWHNKFELIKKQAIDFAPTIVISIFIFIIFYVIAEYYKSMILKKSYSQVDIGNEQETINQNIIYYQLSLIIYYVIFCLGIIFALVNLGFNVATVITLLGTVGLALGLAFQETFKNIISGIYISLTDIYDIGDQINLKMLGSINSISGTIVNFNLYYTTILETKTNLLTTIPNALIQNNMITNISRSQIHL